MKKVEYGKEFRLGYFFLGKPVCSFNDLGDSKELKKIGKNKILNSLYFIRKSLS